LLKESLFPAFQDLNNCLEMGTFMLQHIVIQEKVLEDPKYKYAFSVDAVNAEVLSGIPFREAYKNVGTSIEAGTFSPPETIIHTHEGSIGNLCNPQIAALMDEVLKGFNFEKTNSAIHQLIQ
jgi:argininosuccinate lyase